MADASNLKRDCARGLDAFDLTIDESSSQPVEILKKDQCSLVMRVTCKEQDAPQNFVLKYRSSDDKLVPFVLTAKVEKLVRMEHAERAWSDEKQGGDIVPKRRRARDGQVYFLEQATRESGTKSGCWSVSEYIENANAFNWLTAPAWTQGHSRGAGELLAKLHCAGRLAREKLTGAETTQLATILPHLPELFASCLEDECLEKGGPGLFNDKEKSEMLAVVNRAVADLVEGQNAARLAEDEVIVHGDFHPGNVLFSGEKAVAAIDLDYAHLENPLYDLAYSLLMFAPEKNMGEFADAFIDGYLSYYDRLALDPPAFAAKSADFVVTGGRYDAGQPARQYTLVAAALILIWTIVPEFKDEPGANVVARRMAALLCSVQLG